jgi:hypothetical protein
MNLKEKLAKDPWRAFLFTRQCHAERSRSIVATETMIKHFYE